MVVNVTENESQKQFEAEIDGTTAVAVYEIQGDAMVMTHTEVPQQFRGQGVGEALARAALDAARSRGLKVVPRCPFIASFIDDNAEYQDLLRS